MSLPKEDILRCLFQTVGTLVDAASMQDAHTPGHSLNTARIARTIAQLLGFENDVVDGLRIAATLHDFGNIFVPTALLSKPGKLTDEEFSVVKQHVVYGVEIFKDVEFPWPVVQMILQHHERLDGSGYPNGLKGSEIVLEAQVLGVADAIEAMTSPRPWREALPTDAAVDEIRKLRGITFDPYVVDACIELFTKQRHRLNPEYYGRS